MTKRAHRDCNWGERLPEEILGIVLEKLELYADFIRFGAVCKSWLSATLDLHNQKKRIEFQHHKVPLLLLRQRNQSKLYSVIQKKVLLEQLKFPTLDTDVEYVGSSHGWLITASRYFLCPNNTIITLINPLYIGGRNPKGVIRLLPLNNNKLLNNLGIKKVVLSSDPINGEYMAVVLFVSYGHIAFLKSGNKDWTYMKAVVGFVFGHMDVIFSKQNFYFSSHDLRVAKLNPNCANPKLQVLGFPLPPNSIIGRRRYKVYIVESPPPQRELLLVISYEKFRNNSIGFTCWFEVYKINNGSWVHVESLGNEAIFIGDTCSTSVLVNENQDGLQSNAIYFINKRFKNSIKESIIGMYNLEDKSFQLYDKTMFGEYNPLPIWFLPSAPAASRATAQNVNL